MIYEGSMKELLTEDWHSAAGDPRVKKAATLLAQVAYEHECGPEDLKMLCDLISGDAKSMLRNLNNVRDERHSSPDPDVNDDHDSGKKRF